MRHQGRAFDGSKLSIKEPLFDRESWFFDDKIKGDEGGFLRLLIAGNHFLKFAVIEGGWFFEVDGNPALNDLAMHLGMEIDGGGDHDHIEVFLTSIQHLDVIGEDAYLSFNELPVLLLIDKGIGPRITRADEFGETAFFEALDGGVVPTGEASHSNDSNTSRVLHTILSFGRSCPSTVPTGLPLMFTTMRSSIL
mgnify:CR=1 FL=1